MKEWKVYFSGNFWGHEKGERKSREIPVGKSFLWEGEKWTLPSVYTSGKGLVADFCVEAAPERIRAFMDKWDLWDDVEAAAYGEAERLQIEAENPLAVEIRPQVICNGRALAHDRGCAVAWNPWLSECAPWSMEEAKEVLEHYGCDASKGWVFLRHAFRWETRRKPKLRSLQVKLEREPQYFSGIRFCPEKNGEKVSFLHPVTGMRHTLTVLGVSQGKLDHSGFADGWEWPEHYMQMQYTLSPDLPEEEFYVRDCCGGDAPRQKERRAAALGIIGGADGPTAVFIAGKEGLGAHQAYSSLYFEEPASTEWRMEFRVKMREDITVDCMDL